MNEIDKKIKDEKVELFNQSSTPIIDKQFADIDQIFKTTYEYLPSVSSELLYRVELNKTLKIFLFLMLIGLLMILSVVITSI